MFIKTGILNIKTTGHGKLKIIQQFSGRQDATIQTHWVF